MHQSKNGCVPYCRFFFFQNKNNSDKEAIPYTVEEKSYHLQCLQHKGENRHGVFLTLPEESIVFNCERELSDPRIVHTLNLEYDNYGNLLKQATVAYKRLSGNIQGQNKTWVSLQENTYYELKPSDDFHLTGVPVETINYEIESFADTATKLNISDFQNVATKKIQHQQNFYYVERNGMLEVGDLGEIDKHALQYRSETLAFTDDIITNFCSLNSQSNAPTANEIKAILRQNGYEEKDNEFWMPSQALSYDKNSFYLPVQQIDPLGNITELTYDTYSLLPISVTDPLQFTTNVLNDYRCLQPVKVTDPNGNVTQIAVNTLGLVTKQAINNGKADNAIDFEGDTLDSPTIEYTYYLDNWVQNSQPAFVVTKAKKEHGNTADFVESYEYTDGLGRLALLKATAEDGEAYNSDGNIIQTTTRFVASGRTVYNNKGNIVKQYEPWFSDNSGYESNEFLTAHGVTPIFHYDPLGRLIQTDFPDNTTTKVAFNAWEQQNYDQNDCDVNSLNYNTPQHIFVSPLGIAFKTIDDNRINEQEAKTNENQIITTQTLDILGQVLEVEDALGRNMTQNLYDMAGQLIAIHNIDSGLRQTISNAAQLPVYTWDSRQQKIRNSYDVLLRLEQVFLQKEANPEILVQKIEYGTNALKNNINQIETVFAQDGKTVYDLYDFKGNLLTVKKQFAEDYQNELDWNANPVLLNEVFTTETSYDALNRPVSLTNPDNKTTFYTYDKGGLLITVQVDTNSPYIDNIEYNEKQQRLAVYYGNNTKTKYEYNPLNFRLTRILTTRNTGNDALQDLNYSYDAVGNIIQQTDNAQQTFYFNNQVIAPTGTYTYDALYRLLSATGRELTSLTAPNQDDFVNNIPCPNPAANAMQNYNHNYVYDKLGNMLSDAWKTNNYATANNYLLGHNNLTNQYTYDAHGNMLTMPHLSNLGWDYLDQLHSATNGTFVSYYNYDAEGNRSRKVVIKGNIREERYYIGGYEVFRKYNANALDFERTTLNISDDEKVFVRIETKTNENPVVRYQYDNHLGSACLELDNNANIISYEEYHPFGTTSYRSGRSETEVSLKRYKYNGKERDEETGLYMYGMRYYAAWLCRFVSVDPLQFEYPYYTPYQYAGNKPISFIDLDGGEEEENPYQKMPMGYKSGRGTNENPITLESTEIIGERNKHFVADISNFKFSETASFDDYFIVDPTGGLGVGIQITASLIGSFREKMQMEISQRQQNIENYMKSQTYISATPNNSYYSDYKVQQRQQQASKSEFIRAQQELHPFSYGQPGSLAGGVATNPAVQMSAVTVLTGGAATSASAPFLLRGSINAVTTAIVEKVTTGDVNYFSVGTSFFLNRPGIGNYAGQAIIPNLFNYNTQNNFSTVFDGSISIQNAAMGIGVDAYSSWLGRGFGSFSNNPVHQWGTSTLFEFGGNLLKKQE